MDADAWVGLCHLRFYCRSRYGGPTWPNPGLFMLTRELCPTELHDFQFEKFVGRVIGPKLQWTWFCCIGTSLGQANQYLIPYSDNYNFIRSFTYKSYENPCGLTRIEDYQEVTDEIPIRNHFLQIDMVCEGVLIFGGDFGGSTFGIFRQIPAITQIVIGTTGNQMKMYMQNNLTSYTSIIE